eukprot:3939350-Rhodomonas_salina.1
MQLSESQGDRPQLFVRFGQFRLELGTIWQLFVLALLPYPTSLANKICPGRERDVREKMIGC